MIKRGIRSSVVLAGIVCLMRFGGIANVGNVGNEIFPIVTSGICSISTPDLVELAEIEDNYASRIALEAPKTAQIGVLVSNVTIYTSEEKKALNSEFELLAQLCLAEAENQSELGKRLVIDTVLNRMDSDRFPNTISEIIFQENPRQYTSCWSGRLGRVVVTDEVCELVLSELESRTNSEVLYFNTETYASWASPVICEGDHYFCK